MIRPLLKVPPLNTQAGAIHTKHNVIRQDIHDGFHRKLDINAGNTQEDTTQDGVHQKLEALLQKGKAESTDKSVMLV